MPCVTLPHANLHEVVEDGANLGVLVDVARIGGLQIGLLRPIASECRKGTTRVRRRSLLPGERS